jgi:hypothetical protein
MKIRIDGYRGHNERSFDLKKRNNIISGPMGSGKSGLLHGIMIALLGYDPSISAPGKKARPSDHLLFSDKGKMSVTLEHGEHVVMRGFGSEKPVNRFSWHKSGFVSGEDVDAWAQYATGGCPAIFDVSEFTALSDAAQLKYIAEMLPEEGGALEAQQALAHQLCGKLPEYEASLLGLIHKDRNATISAWEGRIKEEMKRVRAMADEAKKTIASLGDREAELSEPVDFEGLQTELKEIDGRISVIRSHRAARDEREKHVIRARRAIEEARANLGNRAEAEEAVRLAREAVDEKEKELSGFDAAAIAQELEGASYRLKSIEAARKQAEQAVSLNAQKARHETDLKETEERRAGFAKDAEELEAEALEEATKGLMESLAGGTCPVVGIPCAKGAKIATERLKGMTGTAREQLHDMQYALREADRKLENISRGIAVINARLGAMTPIPSDEEMDAAKRAYADAATQSSMFRAKEHAYTQSRLKLSEVEAKAAKCEASEKRLKEAESEYKRAIEAPSAEGSTEEEAVEYEVLVKREAEIANTIEQSRRSVAAAEEVRAMAAKMKKHVVAFDLWKDLQESVRRLQGKAATSQIAIPRENFLAFGDAIGADVEMEVQEGELVYGIQRGEALIPYRACSRGQRMLVGACLQYMFMDLAKPAIRIILIDDAEALGIGAIGGLLQALKDDLAGELNLDAVVVAMNDSISPSTSLEEKVNVIRL